MKFRIPFSETTFNTDALIVILGRYCSFSESFVAGGYFGSVWFGLVQR